MNIAIIIGSTRQNRATPLVAKWVEKTAAKVIGADAELSMLDLSDYELAIFDEPVSPKFNPNRTPEGNVKRWLDDLTDADAYVFVTPEYNHSIPGSLKNALDYIAFETKDKPALMVAHGSMGGVRCTEHLRGVLSELGLVTVPATVNLQGMVMMGDVINDDGTLADSQSGAQGVLESALKDLTNLSK